MQILKQPEQTNVIGAAIILFIGLNTSVGLKLYTLQVGTSDARYIYVAERHPVPYDDSLLVPERSKGDWL